MDQIQGGLTAGGEGRQPGSQVEEFEPMHPEPDEVARGLHERFLDEGKDLDGPGRGKSLAWLDDDCVDVPGLDVPDEEERNGDSESGAVRQGIKEQGA